ncbi:unnamed protein product [Sphagnum balticum]
MQSQKFPLKIRSPYRNLLRNLDDHEVGRCGNQDIRIRNRILPQLESNHTHTNATLIAWPSLGEALAVKLEAVNFGAFAARMLIVADVSMINEMVMMVRGVMRVGGLVAILIKQFFKEIFALMIVVWMIIKLHQSGGLGVYCG